MGQEIKGVHPPEMFCSAVTKLETSIWSRDSFLVMGDSLQNMLVMEALSLCHLQFLTTTLNFLQWALIRSLIT